MRQIPESLSGGAMTLAHCWRVIRRDGVIMGFTDHDEDLVMDGTLYQARTGVTGSDMTQSVGLEVTGGEFSGALMSGSMTEADIAAGLYDGATIEFYRVDWSHPSYFILLERGVMGEIRRSGSHFMCEIRGIGALYQEEKGRACHRLCAADLGDQRCGVDLTQAQYRFSGEIRATDGAYYFECHADPAIYHFTGGHVRFLSGPNIGHVMEIKSRIAIATGSGLWLWSPPPSPILIGVQIALTVGCDKNFKTCGTVFHNQKNFRGFPHIPGTDFVLAAVNDGDPNMDGGSLFR